MPITSTEFLTQNGISEAFLSPSVKDGINQVLKAATMEGVSQFGKILKEEAAKRGVVIGGAGTSTADQQAALDAATKQYEAEQAAAKRKKYILIAVGAVTLLVAVAVGLVLLKKRKP
jgi:CHASE3 domain sensor protein